MSNVGSGGGAPAAGSAVPAASSGAAAVEDESSKEEKVEEKEEESDDDMVRSISNIFNFCRYSLMFLLHYIGFWTFRLIFSTTYDFLIFLGEFVTSLVRYGVMRVHVLTPCQIF